MYTMPFGKYKGIPITDVPTDYLGWFVANCSHKIRPSLRYAINELLGRLPRHTTHEPQYANSVIDWQSVLTKWFREMALKYHPDRGGSVEAMRAIIDANTRLHELFTEK